MRVILGDINRLVNPLATSLMVDTLGKPLTTRLMIFPMPHCTFGIYLVTILSPRKPFICHNEHGTHVG